MIQANCRNQFTAADFSFVVRTLSRSPRQAVSLVTLLSDVSERDTILDDEEIYRSLIDETGCLPVSTAFYFYIVTRRVLCRSALEERSLTDYVASILLAFARSTALLAKAPPEANPRAFLYLSDLLSRLAETPPAEAFLIRKHLAEYALFFSGMFADRVNSHAQRRGAPGLHFYESIGQAAYRDAARHPHARRLDLQAVFELLAAEFHRVRLALNHLAETVLHFHAPAPHLFGAA